MPFQAWAKELRDKRNADNSKDNPDALCLPMGNMQFHTHPQPRRIVQTPGLIIIIYEANYGLRHDLHRWAAVARQRPAALVVRLLRRPMGRRHAHRRDDWIQGRWLARYHREPLTDKAKTIERFRRTNFGTLEIEITVDDPKAYTKPWTVKFNQRIVVDSEMIEFICAENQKFVE